MSHQYEVALYGEFFSNKLKPILNRLTMHCESATRWHVREVIFDPIDAQAQRDQGTDPMPVRCVRDETKPGSGWDMYAYLKAESVRQHPEATVRPWAVCHIVEDALSFASALGYKKRSQLYKRGYAFRRGQLVIHMFQEEEADEKTQEPILAASDTLWEVEVKNAVPVQNTQETPLNQTIDSVLEVQLLMKGLLDLRRHDV